LEYQHIRWDDINTKIFHSLTAVQIPTAWTYSVWEFRPATVHSKLTIIFPVQPTNYLSLHKYCVPFIQPEMLPVEVGNQITSPAVSYLVSDHVGERTITHLAIVSEQIWHLIA